MSTQKNINIIEKEVNNVRKAINKYDEEIDLLSHIKELAEHIKVDKTTYLPVTVFTSVGEDEVPLTPVGGLWTGDTFIAPDGWSINNSLTGAVWSSSATFSSETGEAYIAWSSPVRLTGNAGKDGKDGEKGAASTEIGQQRFKSIVFKRSNTAVIAPDAAEGSYSSPVPEGWSDGIVEGIEKL